MTPEQPELMALYRLRYRAESSLHLEPVGTYLLTRYGKSGRVLFCGPGAMELHLTKQERKNFLRFCRSRQLLNHIEFDDGRREPACS